jgi:DNA-binding CsgD family transcriptional regulator
VSSTEQVSAPGSTGGPLIERDGELGALAAAIACAERGVGALVVIQGPPGIGKSALLNAARAEARARSIGLLYARGGELERAFPYGVARQLLERSARSGEEALLAGAAGLARAPLGLDDDSAAADSELSGAHGLYWLVCNLAEKAPVLLVVDDVQWADDPSLRFLLYLAGRLEALPVAVVVAMRSGEQGELVAGFLDVPGARLLAPKHLTEAGSATLVASAFEGRAAAERFVSVCHSVSGGNPFLINELLQALAQDGIAPDETGADRAAAFSPDAVRRSVLLRMRRLAAGASAFARAVAILGEDVEVRHAAQLADIDPEAALRAADALAALHVLAPGRPLNVAHPMIGEAIRSDLPAAERAALHMGAARLLMGDGAGADRVAPHLLLTEALGDAWVADTLREAAELARRRGALDTAARWLQRALAEGVADDRAGLLRELGEAEWLAARDPAAAVQHLREAFTLAGEDNLRAQAAVSLATALGMTGDTAGAVKLLGEARSHCLGADSDMLLALEAEEAQWLQQTPLGAGRSWKALQRHSALAGETFGERMLLCQLALLKWRLGTAAEAVEFARRAMTGNWVEDTVAHFATFALACWVLACSDAPDAVTAAVRSVEHEGLAFTPVVAATLGSIRGARAWFVGDLGECESQLRFALDSGGLPLMHVPAAAGALAATLAARGDLDGAEQVLGGLYLGPDLPIVNILTSAFYARGYVRQAQGRLEEALADFKECGRRYAACDADTLGLPWRLGAAECLLALGDPDQARALTDEHMLAARHWGTHSAIGAGLRGQALLEHGPRRIELLQLAIEELARSPARLDHARAVVDLGVALRVAGQRAAATEALRDGLERARRCGALTLVEHAHAELVTAGARPRRLQFSGLEALTASERRTASLAAEGKNNTEIAQTLFVTKSTVEKHLTRVYNKLDIHSREELPAALSSRD